MSRFSGRSHGVIRGDVQRKLRTAHTRLLKMTKEISGANSELIVQGAKILQRHIKKQASVVATGLRMSVKANARGIRRMRGDPSAPGEPPRKVSGRLQRGIKSKVVDGERQVRSEHFTSIIHEFGYVAPARSSRRISRGRRKGQMTAPTSARSQKPRPFMRPGLEAATPELKTAGVAILRNQVQKKLPAALGGH